MSSKKSQSSLNKDSPSINNLGSQSLNRSKKNLGSQRLSETTGSQSLLKSKTNISSGLSRSKANISSGLSKSKTNISSGSSKSKTNLASGLSKSKANLTEQPTEVIIEKSEENAENSNSTENNNDGEVVANSENNNNDEESMKEKDKEVEEKLGNNMENTIKEIDQSIKKIEKKKNKKNAKKKNKKSKKTKEEENNEDEKETEQKEGEEGHEDITPEEEPNVESNEDKNEEKKNENNDTFEEYGFSDSDIDYYDEPLIRDIMTPPVVDENSTFTWIPQISDYLDHIKQDLLAIAKREQDERIREMEEQQEMEEEEKEEDKKGEEEGEKKEEEKPVEEKKDEEALTLDEQKTEEGKPEEVEVNKNEEEKQDEEEKNREEDDKNKILTDEELLKNIEKTLDISNIIDVPVLSFGINRSTLSLKEDMTTEEEEEEELKEEEDEKKNEEFMNETFEILRSETPINQEKIDEYAEFFANGNEDTSQFDLSESKNSVHSSKDAFDEDIDDENKIEEEEVEGEKKEGEEGEEEEEKVSNAIDREQFIENLKLEIEKYERNSTKNLFLQNKLYELFRKKRPDEHRDGDKSVNDQEQRYLNSMFEYKELKNEFDDINNKKQEIANSHKEKLQEKKQESDKLYQEFYKQKQHVAQNAKSTRTGNEFSLKVFEQFEAMEKKKDEMVTNARLENIRLQNKLRRQESILRQKEELADGLHLIDFEQLKIENQTYNEKIEERNEELLKLRKKINNIVQVVTHVKEKLQFVQAENVHLKEELKELDDKVTKQRDTLPAIKQSRDKLKQNTQILRQKHGLLGNRILLMDFENKIDETENLKRQVEELQVYHTELMLKRLSYKRKIKKSHIILAGC